MEADPDELHDLAGNPAHQTLTTELLAEVGRQWDLPRLKVEVSRSQRRRRFVYQALTTGQVTPWVPTREDASKRYYRGTNFTTRRRSGTFSVRECARSGDSASQ